MKSLLSFCYMIFVISNTAQASILIEFDIKNTLEETTKPAYISNYAAIILDENIATDLQIEDKTLTMLSFDIYSQINSPMINFWKSSEGGNFINLKSEIMTSVQDGDTNFIESFSSYIADTYRTADGFTHAFSSFIFIDLLSPPRTTDGSSDYKLYGQLLITYLQNLQSTNTPLLIEEEYKIYSSPNNITNFAVDIHYLSYAYITNIAHDYISTPTPEPNTILLLSIGVVGLTGLTRNRRKE